MWALRRASNPLKGRAFSVRSIQTSYATAQVGGHNLDNNATILDSHLTISDRCTCLKSYRCPVHGFPKFSLGCCRFSSQADSKSSSQEEEDLEDGFSELESSSPVASAAEETETETENDLISELSEEDDIAGDGDGLELSDSETPATEKKTPRKRSSLELFKAIMDSPGLSVQKILDKWVEEGKELDRSMVSYTMFNLRKNNMYRRALQLSEWLESSKQFAFVEKDCASRVDLIAKLQGVEAAESYIGKIPKSFRTELIYRTLLANCVSSNSVRKAEEVFNKMKDLEFPLSSFCCNQLLLLYKRVDKKKIADVLLLMEKEDVKATLFTYKLLIDTKGQSNDIAGMDQILETMKDQGLEPDLHIQSTLAKHYANGGLKDKAEAVLKEMEGDDLNKNRWVCQSLLPLYAALDKADEVERIWGICESDPKVEDCMAAIQAWGKLGNVEKAEAAFEKMAKKTKNLSSRHYSALLRVYAQHKMLAKGKDLVKRMGESGCTIGPLTWDALVRLYVKAGEVEKADSVLQKATQQSRMKPMFSTYMAIMDEYTKRGDVHKSEKIFFKLRQAGYIGRLRQFEALIQAYANAKVPLYGIRERMKADNIFPNKTVARMLAQVDPFRKTAVSDLLD